MNTKIVNEEIKEFYEELSQKCDDTITSLEMVCLEANAELFDALELKLPPGKKSLWCILAYGEKGLYIYVNPTETTILGFKVGNNRKPLKEQVFSFADFSTWKAESIVKKTFFWTRIEKYSLVLHITYNSSKAGDIRGTFLIQTQLSAKETLSKMNGYAK